jgi:AcrR family transcriptional regulator
VAQTRAGQAGRDGKRLAVLEGGLRVFARDGYTRAAVDDIAAAAGVSTRTIYNHFGSKAGLFQAVIQHSAQQVGDLHVAIVERHLRKTVELEPELVEFALEMRDSTASYPDHFALVRQIAAERDHVPADAIAAWREVGPLRVLHTLADCLTGLAARGHLRLDDPYVTARHLMSLISAAEDEYAPDPAPRTAAVEASIRAFLHGYAAPG